LIEADGHPVVVRICEAGASEPMRKVSYIAEVACTFGPILL